MLLNIVLLVVGFVLLIKGADYFVEGASKIAEKLHIPQIVIGLTIVAFGTSLPEAAVSITSAYKGTASIGVGNIIGSNIANVLLILGVAGMIGTLSLTKRTFKIETPFVIVIEAVLLAVGYFDGMLSRVDGAILWAFFLLFLYYLYRLTMKGEDTAIDDVPEVDADDKLWKLLLMLVLGGAAVVYGADLSVDSASAIASAFGVSERLIGLTIVSVGTSLPELVTSVTASMKGKNDIAIGNIIGSNTFNVLFVLGTASLVAPAGIAFDPAFLKDGLIAIGAMLLFMVSINKDLQLRKAGAILMFGCYVGYILSLII